eukprot:scpid7900/ scgid3483/ 
MSLNPSKDKSLFTFRAERIQPANAPGNDTGTGIGDQTEAASGEADAVFANSPSPRIRRHGVAFAKQDVSPVVLSDATGRGQAVIYGQSNKRLPMLADTRMPSVTPDTGRERPEGLPLQSPAQAALASSSSKSISSSRGPIVQDAPLDARTGRVLASVQSGDVPTKQSLPGQVSSTSLMRFSSSSSSPASPARASAMQDRERRRSHLQSWKSDSADHLIVPPTLKHGPSAGTKDSVTSDASGRTLTPLAEHPRGHLSFSLSEEDETMPTAELDTKSIKSRQTSKSTLQVPRVVVNSIPAHTALGEELFSRNTDAQRDEEEIKKASCYIEDALEGRYKHGKGNLLSQPPWKKKCFDVQTSFAWAGFIYITNCIFIGLLIVEPPSMCSTPLWVHGLLEIMCLMIICIDIGLKVAYMGKTGYLSKKWHKLSCILIFLYFADLVVFLSLQRPCTSIIRFARPLRPWLLLARNRRLRRVVDTTVRMALPLLRIFFAMAVFIGVFAWIGVHLYRDVYHDKYIPTETCQLETCTNGSNPMVNMSYLNSSRANASAAGEFRSHSLFAHTFDNPLNASLHLFVLLTSENYPYIMEPALNAHRGNFAYFIIYFVSCIQITALNLAVIVQFWIARLTSIGRAEKKKQRLGLAKAFMQLDPKGNGYITEDRWCKVVHHLRSDMDRLKAKFVFDLLDFEQKGCLDVLDFLNISELFNINIKQLDLEEIQTPIPYWKATLRSFLYAPLFKAGTRRFYLNNFLLTLVVIHSLLMSIFYRGMSTSLQDNLRIACTVITAIFVLEIIVKLVAGGEHRMVIAGNAALVVTATVSMAIYWAIGPVRNDKADLIWGLAVGLRAFGLSRNLQFILVYFARVSRVTFWQVAVTAGFLYTIADIGMQTLVRRDGMSGTTLGNVTGMSCAERLLVVPEDQRGFDREPYNCALGFDNIYCATQTVMLIMSTNDWHVLMFDAGEVVGQWVYAYYTATYVIIHFVFINLLVAIAIEMFLLAIKTKFFSTVESRLVETHVANFEVMAEGSHRVLNSVRKRSSSIVRGHVQPDSIHAETTPIHSSLDLDDYAEARQRTVVLQVSKKNNSLVEEFKSFVDSEDLDEDELNSIQALYNTMMKKKKDKTSIAQGCFDAVALQREKNLARARLERPDLLIYALASIRGRGDVVKASGCLVLEVDGHANVASFSCTVKGLTDYVTDSFIHTSDETTPMFILPEFQYDHERCIYSSHGVWKLKHIDRAMLLSERSIVTLCTQRYPQGECGGLIKVEEEITQWQEKKAELKAKCEQFSKISPILTMYAHRVEKRTLEDTLMNRQDATLAERGEVDTSYAGSSTARTEGDGQSSPSMTSLLTEWKTSTQSIAEETEDEEDASCIVLQAISTLDEPDTENPPLPPVAEASQEEMHKPSPEQMSQLRKIAAAAAAAATPRRKTISTSSSSHPKSTSFSVSFPGGARSKSFKFLRRQVHSETSVRERVKTAGNSSPLAQGTKGKSQARTRTASRFGIIENLVNIEHKRRLVSHGSLFVSQDVQNIERMASIRRKSNSTNARSEARRKWQRLAQLRGNKVGIAPTTQQQRIVNEEIQKPEDKGEVVPKPTLQRTTSVASKMIRNLSTSLHPKASTVSAASMRQQLRRNSITDRPMSAKKSMGTHSAILNPDPVEHAETKGTAKRPKTAGQARSKRDSLLKVEDQMTSVSDSQLHATEDSDTVCLLPKTKAAKHQANADQTVTDHESTV